MGDGWKAWTRERLSATEFQGYVQDQVVMSFASSAARTAELAGAETEGMHSYLEDVNRTEYHDGSTWKEVGAGAVLGYGTHNAAVALAAAAVRLSSMAFSVPLRAGRQYQYQAVARLYSSVAADVGGLVARITLGAGAVAVTDPFVAGTTAVCERTTASNQYMCNPDEVFQVATTGSYQVNLWGNRVSGTGVVQASTTSSGRMAHWITDRGVAVAGVPFPI